MKDLTQEKMLEIMCAPERADEPEEPDFTGSGDAEEKAAEIFIRNWIKREVN